MWTSTFWKQTAERAVKTAAQAIIAYLGLVGVGDIGNPAAVQAVLPDWQSVAVTAGAIAIFSACASVATSLASAKIGPQDSPSAVEVT